MAWEPQRAAHPKVPCIGMILLLSLLRQPPSPPRFKTTHGTDDVQSPQGSRVCSTCHGRTSMLYVTYRVGGRWADSVESGIIWRRFPVRFPMNPDKIWGVALYVFQFRWGPAGYYCRPFCWVGTWTQDDLGLPLEPPNQLNMRRVESLPQPWSRTEAPAAPRRLYLHGSTYLRPCMPCRVHRGDVV